MVSDKKDTKPKKIWVVRRESPSDGHIYMVTASYEKAKIAVEKHNADKDNWTLYPEEIEEHIDGEWVG